MEPENESSLLCYQPSPASLFFEARLAAKERTALDFGGPWRNRRTEQSDLEEPEPRNNHEELVQPGGPVHTGGSRSLFQARARGAPRHLMHRKKAALAQQCTACGAAEAQPKPKRWRGAIGAQVYRRGVRVETALAGVP